MVMGNKNEDDLDEMEPGNTERLKELVKNIKLVYPTIPQQILKHMEEASRLLQRKGTYTYLPWYVEVK